MGTTFKSVSFTRLWRQVLVIPSVLVLPAVFLQAGCKSNSEQARSNLDELGVRYSKASFFDRIKRGDRRVVELFLESGMGANTINSKGKSALVVAVRAAEKDIAELLLEKGANLNGRDRREEEEKWTEVKNLGNSPLEAAHWSYVNAKESNAMLRAKYHAIAELLLNKGARVDIESKTGNTLLSNAAPMLETDLINLYLKYGADVNHVGNGGETALTTVLSTPAMTEESGEKVEVVQRLLEAGADVNHQNERGETALMMASETKVVRLLLEHGANPNVENLKGNTALLQTLKTSVSLDGSLGDKEGLKSKKALILARNVADVSEAVNYLQKEGYRDFAQKLMRTSRRSSKY